MELPTPLRSGKNPSIGGRWGEVKARGSPNRDAVAVPPPETRTFDSRLHSAFSYRRVLRSVRSRRHRPVWDLRTRRIPSGGPW